VGGPKPRTILALLQGQSQQDLLAIAPKEMSQYLQIVGTTASSEEAQALLRAGKADLVVVAPTDPATAIGQGKHAQIQVFTDEIDPIRVSYADAYIRDQVAALNQQAIQKSVAGAQSSVGDLRGFVQQAQNYVQLLQSSQGDLARSRDELHQLRSLLDPLAVSMDSLASAAQNSPLFALPGLAQPISQLRQLVTSIDSLKGTVDQLDNQLSAAGNGSLLPTPDDLAKIKANLAQVDQLASQFKTVPADVISAPFQLSMKNVAPFVPTPIGFYAPAVLALLLQHLAVTLGALSMARVRLLGLMDLFQTSPVKPAELATGNYLAYGVLCAVAGALLVALLVLALGVPIFGSPVAPEVRYRMAGSCGEIASCKRRKRSGSFSMAARPSSRNCPGEKASGFSPVISTTCGGICSPRVSTARAKAASLAREGLAKPLIFRTYCSEAARISSSVAAAPSFRRTQFSPTSPGSPPPAARPAHPRPPSRRTCWWRWVSHETGCSERCGLLLVPRTTWLTSTHFSRRFRHWSPRRATRSRSSRERPPGLLCGAHELARDIAARRGGHDRADPRQLAARSSRSPACPASRRPRPCRRCRLRRSRRVAGLPRSLWGSLSTERR